MLAGTCVRTQDIAQERRVILCSYKGHIRLGWDKEWDLRVRLELCHQGPCLSWGEKLAGTPRKMLGIPSPIQQAVSKQVLKGKSPG